MRSYALSRLLSGAVIVAAILVLNFVIVHMVPGDPLHALLGDFPVPPGYAEQVRVEFGLDKPIVAQLGLYLWNLAHGNLGFSFANRSPVLTLVLARLGPTLVLMMPALLFAAVFGVMLGLAAAPRAGSVQDSALTALSLFGYSVPVFWLGQMLVIVFAIKLGWLPAQGMRNMREDYHGWDAVQDVLKHLVLPGFAVMIYY